ncbi:MAG TPA: hypothetical protein VFK50_08280 [Sphingomicrobium sp.]|nr:hypothetical protein [Sphingomicrobium sp.]
MRKRTLVMSLAVTVAVFVASGAAAKDRDPPRKSPLVDAIAACRQIADSTQRLACFDKASGDLVAATQKGDVSVVDRADLRQARRSLFGFNMPKLPFFSGDKSGDEVSDKLVSKITAVKELPHNRYVVRLADGNALWETLESFGAFHAPRVGETVEINRGPLGSFFLRFGKQRGVKGRRVG